MKKLYTLDDALHEYNTDPEQYILGFEKNLNPYRGMYEVLRGVFGLKVRQYSLKRHEEYRKRY